LKYGRKEKKREMRKKYILALMFMAAATVYISVGTHKSINAIDKKETQTIAEYMAEWRRTHPSIESNEVEAVAAADDIQYSDAAGLDFTDEESQMLLKLAMAEAEDQGTIGKAIVICVVKNRVNSDQFPNSIEEVIFQPGQFSPIEDGRYYEAVPDEECYEALEWVLNNWDSSAGAIYFEANYSTASWHRENLEELFTYGDVTFYK